MPQLHIPQKFFKELQAKEGEKVFIVKNYDKQPTHILTRNTDTGRQILTIAKIYFCTKEVKKRLGKIDTGKLVTTEYDYAKIHITTNIKIKKCPIVYKIPINEEDQIMLELSTEENENP